MTKRFSAALLIALLTLSLLTGCAVRAAGRSPAEPQPVLTAAPGQTELPAQTQPPVQSSVPAPDQTVPSGQYLTAEEAQAIALAHGGFTPDQVSFLRTEPELWDHVPHYDVEFREGYWEYEYEIHAETGEILSFEKDD